MTEAHDEFYLRYYVGHETKATGKDYNYHFESSSCDDFFTAVNQKLKD
jgi:hypothetical protein